MLSDEEKEAKLELNRYIYGKNLSKDEIVDYLSIIFGLIQKQSKEIQLLKEQKQYVIDEYEETIEKQSKEIEELKKYEKYYKE